MKLSSVQASVIDALRKKDAYLFESPLYHWSEVIQNHKTLILSIHKPTVEFLKRNNIIVLKADKQKQFILNPDFKFNVVR